MPLRRRPSETHPPPAPVPPRAGRCRIRLCWTDRTTRPRSGRSMAWWGILNFLETRTPEMVAWGARRINSSLSRKAKVRAADRRWECRRLPEAAGRGNNRQCHLHRQYLRPAAARKARRIRTRRENRPMVPEIRMVSHAASRSRNCRGRVVDPSRVRSARSRNKSRSAIRRCRFRRWRTRPVSWVNNNNLASRSSMKRRRPRAAKLRPAVTPIVALNEDR